MTDNEKLDLILETLTELKDSVTELVEKVQNLSLDNDGFSVEKFDEDEEE